MNTQIQTVSFHDQNIVVLSNGDQPYVAMKPICENIGISWTGQLQRIKRHHVLSRGMCIIHIPSKSGEQQYACLPLSMLNGWLFGIEVNRVKPELRSRIEKYQTECFDVLFRHFMPEPLTLPSGLSPAHQRHIQKRVSELAHQPGNSFASVYRSIKDHFQVGTYKDIAESQYPALCRFLQCDPLTGDILEPDKPEGLWLSYCEVQSLYLLMSNAAIVRKLAEEASLYPIANALQSKPLSDLASQITYGGPSFNTLDKRRDEIYAIYSRNGCEGGYAWRSEA